MQYFTTFLEGIITFISPCLLPMLPIYISYFAGGGQRTTKKTITNALGFIMGFTSVFILMGALAGALGSFLQTYKTALNIVCGVIVILFGLSYLDVIKIKLFKGANIDIDKNNMGFFKSLLFGFVFSIGWTPCVGAFLGSALMLASQQGHIGEGMTLLLCYSLGLGIPFLVSAIIIDKLKTTFDFIKKNYKTINTVCGVLLIIIGVLMASGLMNRLLQVLGG